MRRVTVVAGMHRAGTSVLARALQALGIDVGDRLMSADPRMNARGFFEDVDIVRLDDALLDALGADWKSVAVLDDVDWDDPALASTRTDARELLAARLARSGHFGFKDPRIARLLPFFQRIFAELNVADAYVIAVRHPHSVVESLTSRDGLDPRRSGWLWLTHLVCALRYTSGRPRVVVDYDAMLADPARELARMARALGLAAAIPAVDEVAAFQREFLSVELRHSLHTGDDPGLRGVPGVGGNASLLHDARALAQRLARDEADAGSAATTAEVDALFRRLTELSPLLAYAGATERAADKVPRLDAELEWARGSLAEAATFSASLESAMRVTKTYNDELVATLERKDRELAAANAKIERIREHFLVRMLLRIIGRAP